MGRSQLLLPPAAVLLILCAVCQSASQPLWTSESVDPLLLRRCSASVHLCAFMLAR